MLLYAITNRALLSSNEPERLEKLMFLATKWAAQGVDFVQLREKDLPADELARLASRLVQAVREGGNATQVLINADPDTAAAIAFSSGADGVHLAGGLSPQRLGLAIGRIRQALSASATVSVSCHSIAEVGAARNAGATLALFAPVFEKVLEKVGEKIVEKVVQGGICLEGTGIEVLTQACRAGREHAGAPVLPVLALGGVTLENAPQCLAAGASGVAAIRLFLESAVPYPNIRAALSAPYGDTSS